MAKSQLEKIISKHNLSPKELDVALSQLEKSNHSITPSYNHHFSPTHTRIGIVSDTHFGNKATDKQFLYKLYDFFKKQKVEAIYHAGDVIDGFYSNRQGHVYELYAIGAERQIEDVVKNYPEIPGIKTFFIDGNHPINSMPGVDTGKEISNRRKDLIHLGEFNARINLSDKCSMDLVHPEDGINQYAVSYKPQRYIESIEGGAKSNILVMGHYHKAFYVFYRNIHAFLPGTTENQTQFMKGKRIAANKAGLMLDIYTKKDGSIERLIQEWIPDYK